MTLPRSLIQAAFPGQIRMQQAFESLVTDAEDATARVQAALEAIGTLGEGAAGIVAELAGKQSKNPSLDAISLLPPDPGALEQIQAGLWAIRPIDAADVKSLVTREIGDSRWLGQNHGSASAAKLTTARNIAITGDVAWSVTFDGSANVTAAGTLATVNINTGTYGGAATVAQISVNGKGLITGVTAVPIVLPWTSITGTPTTLAGYGITNGQTLNANLTAISGLTTAADKLTYWTGSGTAALVSFPSAARSALATLSGTNTGDQTITLTGDATGSGTGSFAVVVGKINGVALSGLATGILKNTTGTGAPSIAVAADFPTLNQSTTGSAATLTTARNIAITGDVAWNVNFDGSAAVTAAGTIQAGAVTLAKMGNLAANSIIGNNTGSAATPIALTAAQVATFLGMPAFTSATNGAMLSVTNSNAGAGTAGIKIFATGVSQTNWGWISGFDAGGETALRYSNVAGGDPYSAGTSLIRYSTAGVAIIGTLSATGGIGSTIATTQAAGDNSTKVATTAYVRAATPVALYKTILDNSGYHTAGKVAGTYAFGQGDALAVSGTGTLYPLDIIYIDSADFPSVDGLSPKLRIRCNVHCNDVAPACNFVVGLYPITRPATSGAAGLCIYTLGTVVSGSTLTVTTPAADSSTNGVGSDFALPANGFYVIGVVTNATVAASAHVHLSAALQLRNA